MSSTLLSECFPAYTVATLERMIAAVQPEGSYICDEFVSDDLQEISICFGTWHDTDDIARVEHVFAEFTVAPDGYVTDVSDTADNRAFMIKNVTALIQHL